MGGGQEKCVLYLNNKKLTLPTGYSVSQHIWYEIKKKSIPVQGAPQTMGMPWPLRYGLCYELAL